MSLVRLRESFSGTRLTAVMAQPAHAQNFHSKSIRIIEPAVPGSAVAVFARKLNTGLATHLGHRVIVENRLSANSAIQWPHLFPRQHQQFPQEFVCQRSLLQAQRSLDPDN